MGLFFFFILHQQVYVLGLVFIWTLVDSIED